ncbi:biotin carboxyl carrier protein of acetyl-CoA carboxylase 1, chloroplastic-like isoform X2 [Andrographis paniculata]|uniref:biotin carboxyl carrier protein of acetyl-CoA carboxylase 1, chloroplastic-like isoform X2 n=1 Tax=Andrographis paniculata TaxID=175694 RepID=UPI0021E8E1B6|nr:biotin carboxyl carrier protein of acetyl-CoA carboxylase 1, chloroplastic-like isoform X2 [Andrographis paniculata]
MASSFGSAAASVTENAHKSSNYLPLCHRHFLLRSSSNKVSFRLASRPKLRFSSKGFQSGWNSSAVVKAQLNQVAANESSKAAASAPTESEASKAQVKDVKLASEESISEFITQVSSLVKLVDSKDIVELQLKQLDCEILIRKKEALTPSPPPPAAYAQSLPQPAALPPVSQPFSAPTAAPSPSPTPAPSAAPSPPKAPQSSSSHPSLKCPMAGTFYRSPGPGEPPFVKVGDKVKKGQVLCIIEAMKLMNEIEADQSGTIVEILVDDGKSVSVDMPLFVIEP